MLRSNNLAGSLRSWLRLRGGCAPRQQSCIFAPNSQPPGMTKVQMMTHHSKFWENRFEILALQIWSINFLPLENSRFSAVVCLSSIFTCGGSSQVYKCPMFLLLLQRMDFLVSITNISISVRLAHHGYLDIMDIRISGILGYQGYSDIMDIRISQN